MHVSVSKIFCEPTYEGGCTDWKDYKLEAFTDRQYSVEECYAMCLKSTECAGFFLKTDTKHCHLSRKGCSKTQFPSLTYYSLEDCRFGITA